MSEREIEGFVDTIGKKSCDLDPIPASILKECKSALLPVLTNIVNMSLQSASMPAALKEAVIKPKLKKNNLDNQKCVVMLLLDMSAAFDTVDHDLLLERMAKRYGVKGNVLKWFRSYLQD